MVFRNLITNQLANLIKNALRIILITLLANNAFAQKALKLVASEFPPYMSSTFPNQGLLSELVKTVYEHAGYSVTIEVFPSRRAVSMVSTGEYDGAVAAYYWSGREKEFAVSDPIVKIKDAVVRLKTFKAHIETPEDLLKYRVGVVRQGAGSIPNRFSNGSQIRMTELSDHRQSIKVLLSNRVDFVLAPKGVLEYTINSHFASDADKFDIVEISNSENVHTVLTLKLKDCQKIITEFNNSLNELKSNGTVDRLLGNKVFLP